MHSLSLFCSAVSEEGHQHGTRLMVLCEKTLTFPKGMVSKKWKRASVSFARPVFCFLHSEDCIHWCDCKYWCVYRLQWTAPLCARLLLFWGNPRCSWGLPWGSLLWASGSSLCIFPSYKWGFIRIDSFSYVASQQFLGAPVFHQVGFLLSWLVGWYSVCCLSIPQK